MNVFEQYRICELLAARDLVIVMLENQMNNHEFSFAELGATGICGAANPSIKEKPYRNSSG